MWCKKFLYAFSSRKQQEARNPSSPTEPISTPKVWQLWQLWQFSAPTPTSLSLEVTYNIYKYIYNKLNIIITIWKQPEFIYPSPENCHNCHNCHNCNAPLLLLPSLLLHPSLLRNHLSSSIPPPSIFSIAARPVPNSTISAPACSSWAMATSPMISFTRSKEGTDSRKQARPGVKERCYPIIRNHQAARPEWAEAPSPG